MFLQPEDGRALFGLVGADALEDGEAVVQRVVSTCVVASRQGTSLPSIQMKPSRSAIDMILSPVSLA